MFIFPSLGFNVLSIKIECWTKWISSLYHLFHNEEGKGWFVNASCSIGLGDPFPRWCSLVKIYYTGGHLLIEQMLIVLLLHAQSSSRCWGYNKNKSGKVPILMEFTFQCKCKDSNQQTSEYIHTMCEITRGVSTCRHPGLQWSRLWGGEGKPNRGCRETGSPGVVPGSIWQSLCAAPKGRVSPGG